MAFLPVARIGDSTIGVCVIHGPQGGRIITGKPRTPVNGIPVAVVTDTVIANCGHTGRIITGNFTELDEMRPVARITDKFVGAYSGTIVGGSSNTLS